MSMLGCTGTIFGSDTIHNWTFKTKDNKTVVKVEECLQDVFPKLFRSYPQRILDSRVITNLEELS